MSDHFLVHNLQMRKHSGAFLSGTSPLLRTSQFFGLQIFRHIKFVIQILCLDFSFGSVLAQFWFDSNWIFNFDSIQAQFYSILTHFKLNFTHFCLIFAIKKLNSDSVVILNFLDFEHNLTYPIDFAL